VTRIHLARNSPRTSQWNSHFARLAAPLAALLGALLAAASLSAIAARPLAAQRDMSGMGSSHAPMVSVPLGIPLSRMASGTSWAPDSAPQRMIDVHAGDWLLMVHGQAFGQYDRQSGLHGDAQTGLVDWEMFSALRPAAGGLVRATLMTSLERAVLGSRGYPQLLQSGGVASHQRIPNRQHPHDPVGEASAAYDHSLTSKLAASLYVAAVGEPALGPVAYMHRASASADPFAPIGHHWEDASHESAGVITAGLYSRAIKLEGSVFNGRDADSRDFNPNYDGARLDSYAGRVIVAPAGFVALAAWAGYLADHDPLEPGVSMQRFGASLMTTTRGVAGGSLATTLVWGLNNHHHNPAEHEHDPTVVTPTHHLSTAALVESTLEIGVRTSLYARLEQVQKSGYDLGFLTGDLTELFNVREIAVGAARDFADAGAVTFGLGARASVDLLPGTLRLTYQTTHPTGFAIYLRARPRLTSRHMETRMPIAGPMR